MPLVSVIIPCFNQGVFLDETVDSVLQQTFQDFEIIIVNDGSTDQFTAQLLRHYNRPKTTIITTDNQGLAAARNNGIDASNGKYILPLDADDRIGPGYLEEGVDYLESHPDVGIVYCRAELFGAAEGEWVLPEYSLKEMLHDNIIFCTAIFRRCDWRLTGGYDETFIHGWEDYDFWLSLVERGRKVYKLPSVHFYYRVSNNSMVRTCSRNNKLDTFVKLYHKHNKLFDTHIDCWLDTLIDTREKYHEAKLLLDSSGIAEEKFIRKVGPGLCRLEYEVNCDMPQTGNWQFTPADEPVILQILSIALHTSEGQTPVLWQSNADVVKGDSYYFSTEKPSITLTPLPGKYGDRVVASVVICVKYLSFGQQCLPHLSTLIRTEDKQQNKTKSPEDRSFLKEATSYSWSVVASLLVKRTLKTLKSYLLHREYRIIKSSGLFDARYYVLQNPDIDPFATDLLAHFVDSGWREGRDPNPLFDVRWYGKTYPESLKSNPLVHYIDHGSAKGYRPTFLFSGAYYLVAYGNMIPPGKTSLYHYQTNWQQGVQPNPIFDTQYYLEQTPEIYTSGYDPLSYYLHAGQQGRRSIHPLFDADYYCEANPTVAKEWDFPVLHYLEFGAEEGCRPNRFFDPHYYRQQYMQGKGSLLDGFLHYISNAHHRKNRPNALFDPSYYKASYLQPYGKEDRHPLVEYQHSGVIKGYYPCPEVAALQHKPVISIVLPTYNTEPWQLRRCIHSLLFQSYPHWELCIVDDGSTESSVCQTLQLLTGNDPRVKVVMSQKNVGIAMASSMAAESATGEYIAFLDHDDELADDALYEVAKAINEQQADIYYSDEDLINLESRYLDTFYKPAFNNELLLGHNYITHFLVIRRELFEQCGGFRKGYDGAQDFDLTLRLVERSQNIFHITKILYHWRVHETSTSINHQEKSYANEAGRKAIADALQRRGIPGVAETTDIKFFYRPKRKLLRLPRVTLIVNNLLSRQSPGSYNYLSLPENVQIEMIVSDSVDAQYFATDKISVQHIQKKYGESEVGWKNRTVEKASNDIICFVEGLNRLFDDHWLESLLEYAQCKDVGFVGGLLKSATHDDSHHGSVPRLDNPSPFYYGSFVRDVSIHHNGIHCPQNLIATHEGLSLIQRKVFIDAGGYKSSYKNVLFAHLDLCFQLYHEGKTHYYTPYCNVEREETPLTDVAILLSGQKDKKNFQKQWQTFLLEGDPFYNRNILSEHGINLSSFLEWYAGADSLKK